jgi:cyclin B
MFANQPRRTTTNYTYNNKTSVAEKPAAGRRFGTNLSNQYTKYNDVLEKKAEAKPAAKPAASRQYTYNAPVAANKYTRPTTAAAQPKAQVAAKPFQAATQRAVDDLTSQVSSINIGNVSAAVPSRGSSAVDSSRDRAEPQMVCSYITEILSSHRRVEPKFQPDQYIESGKQTQVSKKVRCTLVDWVVEVHRKFKLKQETLFLAINILDRFLSARGVSKDKLQLVASTCIFVASKWEDMWPPLCKDLVYVGSRAFSKADIVKMEVTILNAIKFDIGVPTSFRFFKRYAKAAGANTQMNHLVSYLIELTMHDYDLLRFTPSMIAASCTNIAQKMLRSGSWDSTLRNETGYTEDAIAPCVDAINTFFHALPAEVKNVKTKYTSSKFSNVASIAFAQ